MSYYDIGRDPIKPEPDPQSYEERYAEAVSDAKPDLKRMVIELDQTISHFAELNVQPDAIIKLENALGLIEEAIAEL